VESVAPAGVRAPLFSGGEKRGGPERPPGGAGSNAAQRGKRWHCRYRRGRQEAGCGASERPVGVVERGRKGSRS